MKRFLEPRYSLKPGNPSIRAINMLTCHRTDTPQPYRERDSMESDQGQRKACSFKRSWLEGCSGKTDNTYGFQKGSPCIIVKLNRIVNFRPRVGEGEVGEGVGGFTQNDQVTSSNIGLTISDWALI